MFGSRTLGSTLAAMAAFMGLRPVSSAAMLPPPVRHRQGLHRAQRNPQGVDMYYLSAAGRRAMSKKAYPHSSEKQIARHRKNYGSLDGVIFPLSREMRREIKRIQGEQA